MKIAEYKQMMEYLTRPGFGNGGNVLPKKKPKEEAEKVNKARKEKNFEKVKGALENPKEVKEMIDKPKRGLVNEPGSYAGDPKVAAKNIAAWKKANPDLNFDILRDEIKTRIRQGSLTAGTFTQKTPNVYTISELAKVEGMPFTLETLKADLISKKKGKKLQKAFKDAGIELLPKIGQQTTRYKMLNATKSMEKLTDYAMTLDRPPKKFIEPYKKQIPIEYKKLIKSGKPFSVTDLKNAVFESLPKNVYKVGNTGFDAMIRRALTEDQRKKFTLSTVLKQTENLQPRKVIIDNILNGKTNIKQLANASNLSEKEVGEQIQRIFRTIYQSREKIGAKKEVRDVILKDYSLKDFEKILTNINKEPTLDSYFRQGYRDFLFEAIGNPNNPDTHQPKKYARAIERLIAYESINKKLEENFGIKLALDHSLSKGAIKTIENAEPSQFLRVNPIPENINAGIKKSFDIRYQNVIKDLKSGQFRGEELKNLLIQKAELEKLSKDIGLQFGKMSPTGKIIKYDAVDFLNKNLPSEIKEGVSLPNRIRQTVDKMNPTVLKERFKVAFGDKADDALEILNKIKKQDNLQDIYKFLKPLLKVKGLRVDASDFLNQASEVIFPTLQAAEVLPGEAQAAIPKPKEPMNFDLDMSLPKPSEPLKYLPNYEDAAFTGAAAAGASKYMKKGDPLKKFRRFITAAPVRKGLGKIFRGFGTPLSGLGFAGTNVYNKMKEGKSFSEAILDPLTGLELAFPSLFTENVDKITKNPGVQRVLNLGGLQKFLGPVGVGISTASSLKDRSKAMSERGEDISKLEDTIKQQKEIEDFAAGDYRGYLAGGGIAKLAGKSSGRPPESGPTPQGLDFLMKRGR